MPAHPETGVDPVVDRFAIYDTSISDYTHKTAVWPVSDGGPIEGGNPNRLWYKRQPTPKPEHDHRWSVDTEWNNVDTDPAAPAGHPRGVYLESHTLVKRPVETLKAQVLDETKRQFALRFPQQDSIMELSEVADALARKEAGLSLTPAQTAILEAMIGVGDVVSQLRARQAALNAAIDADEDYDLSVGWPA